MKDSMVWTTPVLYLALAFWSGSALACSGKVSDVSIYAGNGNVCIIDDACPCPVLGGAATGPRCFSMPNDSTLNRLYATALTALATGRTVVIDRIPSGPTPGTCGMTAMRITTP